MSQKIKQKPKTKQLANEKWKWFETGNIKKKINRNLSHRSKLFQECDILQNKTDAENQKKSIEYKVWVETRFCNNNYNIRDSDNILDSDWLRGVQYKRNTRAKSACFSQ